MRKSAVFIPSNIEDISYGSVCELETKIWLAGDLGFIEKVELGTVN